MHLPTELLFKIELVFYQPKTTLATYEVPQFEIGVFSQKAAVMDNTVPKEPIVVDFFPLRCRIRKTRTQNLRIVGVHPV